MAFEILSSQQYDSALVVMFIILAILGIGTLLLVATSTPPYMRHYGYFILNINFWFYLSALLACMKHTDLIEIKGNVCFELHMLITIPLLSSTVYSILSILSVFCGYLAILLTFIFLMIRVVFLKYLHKIKTWMGLLVVVTIQFGISGGMAFFGSRAVTPADGQRQVLCVSEKQQFMSLTIVGLSQLMIVSVLLVVIIVIIVRKMKIQKVSQQTRKLQRMLLKTLIITALIPIVFKSIPSVIASVALLKQWPEYLSIQRLTGLLTLVQAIANGMATVVCIRCYRERLWKLTTFWRHNNYKVFNVVSTINANAIE